MCVYTCMSVCVCDHMNVSMIKKEFQRRIGQHCQVPIQTGKYFQSIWQIAGK